MEETDVLITLHKAGIKSDQAEFTAQNVVDVVQGTGVKDDDFVRRTSIYEHS